MCGPGRWVRGQGQARVCQQGGVGHPAIQGHVLGHQAFGGRVVPVRQERRFLHLIVCRKEKNTSVRNGRWKTASKKAHISGPDGEGNRGPLTMHAAVHEGREVPGVHARLLERHEGLGGEVGWGQPSVSEGRGVEAAHAQDLVRTLRGAARPARKGEVIPECGRSCQVGRREALRTRRGREQSARRRFWGECAC